MIDVVTYGSEAAYVTLGLFHFYAAAFCYFNPAAPSPPWGRWVYIATGFLLIPAWPLLWVAMHYIEKNK